MGHIELPRKEDLITKRLNDMDKPKPVSGANRKASERARRRKAGFVPMEFWVRPKAERWGVNCA